MGKTIKEFTLSRSATKKYIHMTDDEVAKMDFPNNYKKRKTVMDDYINIIYKMLCDKRKPAVILSYVVKSGYNGSLDTLVNYIKLLSKNNFNISLGRNWSFSFVYPDDVTVIKRNELLKYITTKNPKLKKIA